MVIFYHAKAMKWRVLVGLLLASFVGSTLPDVDMDNEHKLSYCSMLSNKRIYKQEKLDLFCSLKVQQWDGQVICQIPTWLYWRQLTTQPITNMVYYLKQPKTFFPLLHFLVLYNGPRQ